MSKEEAIKLEIVTGAEGKSVYLNDYRICGPKPWGGGQVDLSFNIKKKEIANALALLRDEPCSQIKCKDCDFWGKANLIKHKNKEKNYRWCGNPKTGPFYNDGLAEVRITREDYGCILAKSKQNCSECGGSGRVPSKSRKGVPILHEPKRLCPKCKPKEPDCSKCWYKDSGCKTESGCLLQELKDINFPPLKHTEDCAFQVNFGGSPCDCPLRLKRKKKQKEPKPVVGFVREEIVEALLHERMQKELKLKDRIEQLEVEVKRRDGSISVLGQITERLEAVSGEKNVWKAMDKFEQQAKQIAELQAKIEE